MAQIKFCGNPVNDEEMKLIRELSEEFWGISRTELASTVCELLGWKRPGGGLKTVDSICCFFCNQHNKKVRASMMQFCEENSTQFFSLAGGALVDVSYEFKMETEMVTAPGRHGSGATLESYHILKFATP